MEAEAKEEETRQAQAWVDETRTLLAIAAVKFWMGTPFDEALIWFVKQLEARYERDERSHSEVSRRLDTAA